MTSSPLPAPVETEPYEGNALRVYGPPGTGKTTYLAKRIQSTIAQYGPASTMIASYSVTAAKEIGSRFTGETKPLAQMVGTLHSHAFRAIGHPTVALDPKVLGDWNDQVVPEWKITPSSRYGGGAEAGTAFVNDPSLALTGDELVGAIDRLRAARIPAEDWPPNVREFHGKYAAWKAEIGAIDFTDMIVGAHARAIDGERPPGNPSRLVVDEAQDMTPLETALVLAWGRGVERLVIGMDDDQAINRWRGGDPEPLLALHGPNVTDHVLEQSYRVPESVRQVAERWVRSLSHRRDKEYRPRVDQATGEQVLGAAFRVPVRLNSLDLVHEAIAEADLGHTVMIIASCNYMLEPLVNNLRDLGVPFHNPYRPAEGRWNPLGKRAEGTVSTAQRVKDYLALAEHDWTGAEIQSWTELVKLADAGMRTGAKKAIAGFNPNAIVDFEEVEALFADRERFEQAVRPDLDWLAGALLKGKRKPAEYPIQIARHHGAAALDVEPRIVVGTIHSVKGATADVVYVAPDVSAAAARAMGQREGLDETIRQFYVAMTRAYRELRVLAPSTQKHVRPDELIPSRLEVFPS